MDEKNKLLYKLMLLYMLQRVDFSLSFAQISDFILEKGYTDYFTLQVCLSELIDSSLIHAEVIRNVSYYTLTPEGEKTIGMFTSNINREIRSDIDRYLETNELKMRDENSVQADCYRNTAGDYTVRCYVREKDTVLIDLKLTVPEQAQAKAICGQWKKQSQDIYAYVMQKLMK